MMVVHQRVTVVLCICVRVYMLQRDVQCERDVCMEGCVKCSCMYGGIELAIPKS